jgi:hypothetical protein
MYTTENPIDMHRFNISELKEFLAFSVKDKYQLNYFICIKDFNVQTKTKKTTYAEGNIRSWLGTGTKLLFGYVSSTDY